jgi:hypothetical protein
VVVAAQADTPAAKQPEFPPFEKVSEGYKRVVTRPGDAKSLYTVWVHPKKHQMLAELSSGFEGQKIFIATSIAGGSRETGWQWRELYCYWTRHDKRLVLMEPQLLRQAGQGGDDELKRAIERTYGDRVVTWTPIVAMGPGGGPVINLNELLVRNSKVFTGLKGNASLAKIGQVKAFPQNLEIPITIPMGEGDLTTLHYSISVIPKTDYRPRDADERVGYFLTVYKDLTKVSSDGSNFVRHVNRWNLQKRDPSLSLSPPTQPIVFYIEHTVPVRYRRFVRDGILEWNKAFEKVGIIGAIEVRQQDAKTNAFMDVDPEDVRYNFFRWISSERAFAMGPSRVNPETGEILDADIIFDDAMLKLYALRYKQRIAAYGLDGVDPEALAWIRKYPRFDPMMRFDPPNPAADAILADPGLSDDRKADFVGLPYPEGNDDLHTSVVQQNRWCGYALGKSMQMQTAALAMRLEPALQAADESDDETPASDEPLLDGVPESYLGSLLREIVMHEVGHTLGLRHNFRASAWLSLDEYAVRQGTANVGSVMDYNPVFVPLDASTPRGDWVTSTIGPYDYWAIEYGYGLDEKRRAAILKKVADPELQFATDEDTWGPDPLVARFDLGSEPLAWAEMRMELVRTMRAKLPDAAVEDGESWHLLRQAYETMLGEQLGALRLASRYVGGVHIHRDRKGDPDGRDPLEPTDVAKQRRALRFVVEHAFFDEAFDLRPEVLTKLATDKHRHWGNPFEDEAFLIHDRIAQIQSFALLYLMNPGTLRRVHDNELRVPSGQDALTVAELLNEVADAVYRELDRDPAGAEFSNRSPMISSLRRNLQAELTDLLIGLALNDWGMPRSVPTLALARLQGLQDKVATHLARPAGAIDDYTAAHLLDQSKRIERALDAVYLSRR